jgi:hypothetical protein
MLGPREGIPSLIIMVHVCYHEFPINLPAYFQQYSSDGIPENDSG